MRKGLEEREREREGGGERANESIMIQSEVSSLEESSAYVALYRLKCLSRISGSSCTSDTLRKRDEISIDSLGQRIEPSLTLSNRAQEEYQ